MTDLLLHSSAELASAEDYDLVLVSRKGIPIKDFLGIVQSSGFPMEDWAEWLRVGLSELIALSRHEDEHYLDPYQSERVLDINKLLVHSLEVFGNADSVIRWFNHQSIPLGGVTPKSLLDTTFGINMVRAEIGRIEHGVLA